MKQRKNSIEILKYLISNSQEVLNIADVAKGTKINYKNTYDIIKKLQNEKIIEIDKIGSSNIIKLHKKINPKIYQAEFEKKIEITSNKDIKAISQKFEEFTFPCIGLLFGSYAKGRANKHSDIDLLIVADESKEKLIWRKFGIFSFNIHLVFFTFEEFISMIISKQFTVVSEAISCNVILHGIEQYYNLLYGTKKKYILNS
ncbi:MAG: nucleotidyltransferase domain-containing protein [Methanobrevibacter sp.]|nr:nucleotidyltransferase domain-containing protein [Methanobrevibacter sp.]